MDVQLSEAEAYPLQIQGRRTWYATSSATRSSTSATTTSAGSTWTASAHPHPHGWTSRSDEIYLLDASRGVDLWERIMEAGTPYEMRPTGPVDIRRIEGGIFNWGADMTYENNLFELGLERLVDLDGDADSPATRSRGFATRA